MKELLLLAALLQLSASQYTVYISNIDIYFTEPPLNGLQDHAALVVSDGVSKVSPNGSLYITNDAGVSNGFLSPFPPEVDHVTITWSANTTGVSYSLSLTDEPAGVFGAANNDLLSVPPTGDIPVQTSEFTIGLLCGVAEVGDLIVDLTTVHNSTSLHTVFTLSKDCQGPVVTSTVLMSTSRAIDPTTTVLITTGIPSILGNMTSSQSLSREMAVTTSLQTQAMKSEFSRTLSSTQHEVSQSASLASTATSPSTSLLSSATDSSLLGTSSSPVISLMMSPFSTATSSSSQGSSPPAVTTSLVQTTSVSSLVIQPTTAALSSPSPYVSLALSSSSLLTGSLSPTPMVSSGSVSSLLFTPSLTVSSSSVFSETSQGSSYVTGNSMTPSTSYLSSTADMTTTPSLSISSSPVSFPKQSSSVDTSSSIYIDSFSPAVNTSQVPATSSALLSSFTTSSSLSLPTLSVDSSPLDISTTPLPVASVSPSSSSPLDISTTPLPVASVSPSSSSPLDISTTPLPVASVSPSPSKVAELTTSSVQLLISVSSVSPSVLLSNGTIIPNKEPQLVMLLLIAFAPIAGMLVLCILITGFCICCICCKKRKTQQQFSDDPSEMAVPISSSPIPIIIGGTEDKKHEAPISLWTALPWGMVASLPGQLQRVIAVHAVDRRSLSLISTINRGQYGCVVNGQLSVDRTDPVDGFKGVMMKMLTGFQEASGHGKEVTKFLESATLLKDLEHPNIACAMKLSVTDNLIPVVLYPIVEYGNLHTFLKFCRVSPTESPLNPVTLRYKVNFGLQISYALRFITEQGIVHPDLALRNCFLDTNYLVKVGDGALAQEFFPECYSVIKGSVRPVRWAALETINEGLCTVQSNVWSYAVVLWEVLTTAEVPYTDVTNNRVIPSHVGMGGRLPQPTDCPLSLYELMLQCWAERAENRPNFAYLHYKMEELNNQLLSPAKTPPGLGVARSTDSLEPPSQHSTARRRRSGRSSYTKGSPSATRKSGTSRISGAGSEHLSLTFSVLSEDLTSGSGSDDDQRPDLSPLPESVVYQMLPSLLKEDKEESGLENVQTLPTSSPMNLVNSFLDSNTSKRSMELESSTKSTLMSPATPSTITTRLTPSESISYSSSQFVRSDESASTPHHTPSPDLTSKSSTFGEEANPRHSHVSQNEWQDRNGLTDPAPQSDVAVDLSELSEPAANRSSLALGDLTSDLLSTFDNW